MTSCMLRAKEAVLWPHRPLIDKIDRSFTCLAMTVIILLCVISIGLFKILRHLRWNGSTKILYLVNWGDSVLYATLGVRWTNRNMRWCAQARPFSFSFCTSQQTVSFQSYLLLVRLLVTGSHGLLYESRLFSKRYAVIKILSHQDKP